MATQTCNRCGETYPLNRDHFGNTNNRGVIGWRGVCRACMRANSAKHAAENPEQYAQRRQLRQKREMDAGSSVPDTFDRQGLRAFLGDKCRYCEADLEGGGELDHLTPVARGGSGNPGNLTLCCRACNRSKLAKTLDEYLHWRRERELYVRSIAVPGEAPDVATVEAQRRTF